MSHSNNFVHACIECIHTSLFTDRILISISNANALLTIWLIQSTFYFISIICQYFRPRLLDVDVFTVCEPMTCQSKLSCFQEFMCFILLWEFAFIQYFLLCSILVEPFPFESIISHSRIQFGTKMSQENPRIMLFNSSLGFLFLLLSLHSIPTIFTFVNSESEITY